jgi:hypothetical protein
MRQRQQQVGAAVIIVQLLLCNGAYSTMSVPSSSDATVSYMRKVTAIAAHFARGRDVCRFWRVALQSDRELLAVAAVGMIA